MSEGQLEIKSMFVTGRLPENFLPIDFQEITEKYGNCEICNEEKGGYLKFSFNSPDNPSKKLAVAVYNSGKIIIFGVVNFADAVYLFDLVKKTLENIKHS